LDTYARCVRITRDQPALELSADLLQEEAERELYGALRTAESRISPDSDVNALMAAFVPLVPHIRRFFDDVLVMAKDEDLRRARLALLQRIAALAAGIVDLSKLEGF
jgi:glycyl-tRNA synthetase beta subunit